MSRFVLLIILLVAGCAHPPETHTPVDPSILPTTFEYTSDSFWGGGYSIKGGGEKVVLTQFIVKNFGREPKWTTLTFRPSAEQWKSFWRELAILEVFRWREKYDSNICDGHQWKLKISYRGGKISSFGNCYFPSPADVRVSSMHGERIGMLESAIQRLIGHSLY